MSIFKKFCDAFVAFCALCGIIGLLRRYMDYTFTDDEMMLGAREKIKIFLSPEAKGEPYGFAIFVGLIVISFLVSRIFPKLPVLALVSSVPPLFFSGILFFNDKLGDFPLFFVLSLGLGFVGALYDSFIYDKEKNRTLTHHAAAIIGAIFGAFALFIPKLAEKYEALTKIMPSDAEKTAKLVADKLKLMGVNLFFEFSEEELKLLGFLFALTVISLILSYLLRGAYFIDLAFAGAIFLLVLAKWHAGVLVRTEAPIIALAAIYFAMRLAIFFAEPEPQHTLKKLLSKIKSKTKAAED